MKELLVISGKGGTGKTTVVGAFAMLADNAVVADCDVDAANLHLLLNPQVKEEHAFHGLPRVRIDRDVCTSCGLCLEICRFGAISPEYVVDPLACEGCGVCVRLCPAEGIIPQERVAGQWFVSETPFGPLVHARLNAAEDNSGRLVAEVRRAARAIAKHQKRDLIITDGPPGISCPVISSLTGIDLALLVTEPSVSGWHDLARVLELAEHFKVRTVVCINKADLHELMSKEIKRRCYDRGIEVIGSIPFDEQFAQATVTGHLPIDDKSPAVTALYDLWEKTYALLMQEKPS
ncbi:MAG: 4Fe-4S binding protein [Firmicutes bacterium]|jgi:MinD superfamily P-loop ATPase|nr:4Fe-4S binding protein [Bacillota bacterium]